MRSPEKFATSLVSLALVRNGYITYKDVPCGGRFSADILATRMRSDNKEETFVVAIKALRDRDAIPGQLDRLRDDYRSACAHAVFFAFLIDSEEVLLVDPELHERMRFLDEDISLEVISGESIASGLQV